MGLTLLALLFAAWAGLLRLGWSLPALPRALPAGHGPLMISGFLGTLIIVERVVALQRNVLFAGPLLTAVGWVLMLVEPSGRLGSALITLGSGVAVLVLGIMIRRETRLHTITMGLGTLAWLLSNLVWWLGRPVFQIVYLWMAFLVLTIAGERLELSRVLRPTPWQVRLFALAAGLFLLGALLAVLNPIEGARLAGAGMLGLAAWLLRFDIARHTLRHENPLTRFIGRCLFTGYLWLGAAGLLLLVYGGRNAGPLYDAGLHAVFLGFVFSMIFGHAPIILPALVRIPLIFHPVFYVHLVLLHASLTLRVVSDLVNWRPGIQWGGMLNVIAVLLFLGVTLVTARQAAAQKQPAEAVS